MWLASNLENFQSMMHTLSSFLINKSNLLNLLVVNFFIHFSGFNWKKKDWNKVKFFQSLPWFVKASCHILIIDCERKRNECIVMIFNYFHQCVLSFIELISMKISITLALNNPLMIIAYYYCTRMSRRTTVQRIENLEQII